MIRVVLIYHKDILKGSYVVFNLISKSKRIGKFRRIGKSGPIDHSKHIQKRCFIHRKKGRSNFRGRGIFGELFSETTGRRGRCGGDFWRPSSSL